MYRAIAKMYPGIDYNQIANLTPFQMRSMLGQDSPDANHITFENEQQLHAWLAKRNG